MPKLSLGQAAKHAGVSKTSLSRWIEKGKITAEKQTDGSYLIDPSEIDRINSEKERRNARTWNRDSNRDGHGLQSGTPMRDGGLQLELEVLREKDRLKEEKISEMKETIQDLKSERDEWRSAHQRLLLTYQPPVKPSEKPPEDENAKEGRGLPDTPEKGYQRATVARYGLFGLLLLALTGVMSYFQDEIKTVIDQGVLGKMQRVDGLPKQHESEENAAKHGEVRQSYPQSYPTPARF